MAEFNSNANINTANTVQNLEAMQQAAAGTTVSVQGMGASTAATTVNIQGMSNTMNSGLQKVQGLAGGIQGLVGALGIQNGTAGLIGSVAGATAQFAMMGSALGPGGALIGGIAGLVTSLGSVVIAQNAADTATENYIEALDRETTAARGTINALNDLARSRIELANQVATENTVNRAAEEASTDPGNASRLVEGVTTGTLDIMREAASLRAAELAAGVEAQEREIVAARERAEAARRDAERSAGMTARSRRTARENAEAIAALSEEEAAARAANIEALNTEIGLLERRQTFLAGEIAFRRDLEAIGTGTVTPPTRGTTSSTETAQREGQQDGLGMAAADSINLDAIIQESNEAIKERQRLATEAYTAAELALKTHLDNMLALERAHNTAVNAEQMAALEARAANTANWTEAQNGSLAEIRAGFNAYNSAARETSQTTLAESEAMAAGVKSTGNEIADTFTGEIGNALAGAMVAWASGAESFDKAMLKMTQSLLANLLTQGIIQSISNLAMGFSTRDPNYFIAAGLWAAVAGLAGAGLAGVSAAAGGGGGAKAPTVAAAPVPSSEGEGEGGNNITIIYQNELFSTVDEQARMIDTVLRRGMGINLGRDSGTA